MPSRHFQVPSSPRGFPTRLRARKDPNLHETCGPMQALNKDTPVTVALAKFRRLQLAGESRGEVLPGAVVGQGPG